PLELWGEPSYTLPWIRTNFFGQRTLIVNDPGLIKHVLVDNANNYRMSDVRQLVLRPILRDGLLTAEGPVWKRSRKAVAPVFTPRHAQGFAGQMLRQSEDYARKYESADEAGAIFDISTDMTELTFAILADTLFSGEIVTSSGHFADDVNELLHRMGRVDPMDLMRAPSWVPRVTRIGGQKVLEKFRAIVRNTMDMRLAKMKANRSSAPEDFLTLLLEQAGPEGLTKEEIEDNILTF
ncbi:cytochrome P450, partial [Rhizobium ruizarguesonis]